MEFNSELQQTRKENEQFQNNSDYSFGVDKKRKTAICMQVKVGSSSNVNSQNSKVKGV